MGDNEQRWLMWYSGTDSSPPLPGLAGVMPATGSIGMAAQHNGTVGSVMSGASPARLYDIVQVAPDLQQCSARHYQGLR